MAQIFLSYSSADRERVQPLVEALQDDGFTVWWDRDIHPGPSFDREIEQAINGAHCMVVVWSSKSVESEWVRSEVEEGVRRGILVPVMIESVMPPLAYRRRQSANLSQWNGEPNDEYEKLLTGIRAAIKGVKATEIDTGIESNHSSPSPSPIRRRRKVKFGSAILAVVFTTLCAIIGTWYISANLTKQDTIRPLDVSRLEVNLPEGSDIPANITSRVNITDDGKIITFISRSKAAEMTYMVRELDSFESRSIGISSQELGSHWLSPDNASLIYNDIETKSYRKISLSGGPSVVVAQNKFGRIGGLALSPDGQIVHASDGPWLSILDANDKVATQLTTPDAGKFHSSPHFTADGKALLFTQSDASGNNPIIKLLDLDSGDVKTITAGDRPQLTSSGHLVVLREDSLWAAPFDLASFSIGAEPVLVFNSLNVASPSFDISNNGTLIYMPERQKLGTELVWINAGGQSEPLPIVLDRIGWPRLSPNGDEVLLHGMHGMANSFSIWSHSLQKETTTMLTFNQSLMNVAPSWDSNGKGYVYLEGDRNLKVNVILGSADGVKEPIQLTEGRIAGTPIIAPDGRTVIFLHCKEVDSCDIAKTTTSGGDYTMLLETPFSERSPEISPDGKWLAYSSNESGRFEVYVRPFPDINSGRWQVSSSGGEAPMWSRDGTQLFFVERQTSQLMTAAISNTQSFNWAAPVPILDISNYKWNSGPRRERNFDISKDGERFLMLRQSTGPTRLMVVLNWLEEVKKQVPVNH